LSAHSEQEHGGTATTRIADADATQLNPPKEAAELRPGDILRQRFVIERMLGEGGMGKVFLAVDREAEATNPHVALKMLGEGFKEHPQSLKALRREATQSQRLNHPNIVNVFFFERTEEHVFMVMEYMQGKSLDDYIAERPDGGSFSEVWPVIEGMSQGLMYIHKQKIIHSDFKPSNVFFTDDGEVKVLDLGIARSLDENNAVLGTTSFDPDALGALTPTYASCEMFEGLSPTEQDDLYALGCVVYELLTGGHPYGRKTAIEARAESLEPKRPRGLKNRQWRALKASLGYTRADRPRDVAAFYEEFAPQKKSTRIPWAAAAVSVVFAGVVSAFVLNSGDNSDQRFVRATLDKFPPGDNLVDTQRAQDWLQQGGFFQQMGEESLRNGAFDRAVSQLLTAPSSALQSYRLVLNRSNDAVSRDTAVQGMLSIANAFKARAMGLAEAEAGSEDMAKVVCVGLDINQYDSDMLGLYEELAASSNSLISETPACMQLINTGKIAR